MLHRRAETPRPGFTLIEILVVIAIIAILMALLIPAVMNVLTKREQVENFNEIYQIGTAIGECKTQLKLDQIPPGPFMFKQYYNGSEPELAILLRAFPQLSWQTGTAGTGLIPAVTNKTDTTTNCVLDSNQTLLFFLTGGTITGFNGFSTNPSQPFVQPGNVGNMPGDSRKGPYLKLAPKYYTATPMNSARTMVLTSTTSYYYNGTTTPLAETVVVGKQSPTQAWLVDAYGLPLAYFAAVNGKSGLYYAPLSSTSISFNTANPTYQSYTVTYGAENITVSPYISNGAFVNPTGFQLISSGKDWIFGPGGTALPATGNGNDDQANFSTTILGAGIN